MNAIIVIPINEIRVVNPRSRNRISFNAIRQSIASVGLKKPITVHQRDIADDGTRYNLVCGQGRLEAMRELGETMIPAVIKQAPEDECYLMSLIENLARLPPSTRELLREVKRLTGDGHTPNAIAERLGMDKSYIRGIARLIHSGEDDLIHRVEAGQLPIDTAIKIATGKDEEIQRALTDAYANGTLRGAKLRAVQQLLLRRKGHATPTKRLLTGEELLRTFEHHTQQQRALVRRSGLITQRLAILSAGLRQLLADEYFVTLLRAELLDSLPAPLATRIQQGS